MDTLDHLDRQIVHALQINPVAPMALIAEAVGVSAHTVTRRYRRMRGQGILRVVGIADGVQTRRTDWFVRLRCVPDGAMAIAAALARRDDVSWVMLGSAGAEISCLVSAESQGQRDALLLGMLPRSRKIVQIEACSVLRMFAGGPTGWAGRCDALTPAQIDRLTPEPESGVAVAPRPLDAQDRRLLAELRVDARRPVSELAPVLGCSQPAASRRLNHLIDSRAVQFDVEIVPERLGYQVQALLWVMVAPGRLAVLGDVAARHPRAAMVAATSGRTNLLIAVGCRDSTDLYDYVTADLGGIDGVLQIETAPVMRTVKRWGTMLTAPSVLPC